VKGPTYFFNNGKPVRRKRFGPVILPALPTPPATENFQPERVEPQRDQPNRSLPDRPVETVAAVASVSTVRSPVVQLQSEPEPPARPDPWETVLTALREDQEQRKQEWRRQQQEHQERMTELQQQMKVEVEAAMRRVLES
jgi:hypothetical protein